jgi:hypothetical protein
VDFLKFFSFVFSDFFSGAGTGVFGVVVLELCASGGLEIAGA